MTRIDTTKPVQTRDGRKVTILATNVLALIPGTSARQDGQTLLALIEDEVSPDYFTASGQFDPKQGQTQWDLVNAPERTETYHTFKYKGPQGTTAPGVQLGCLPGSTYAAVSDLAALSPHWDGIAKVTLEDGKFISAEAVTA